MKQGKGGGAGHGKGHTPKHSGTHKHVQGQGKHHPQHQHKAATHHHAKQGHKQPVHTVAKGQKGHKPRGLALGEAVACCTAEALAASLRLTGRPVSDADVLALYQHTADTPDVGASILVTLVAASRWGLAGVCPSAYDRVPADDPRATILGLELPGPHAVAVDDCGCWWSWG